MSIVNIQVVIAAEGVGLKVKDSEGKHNHVVFRDLWMSHRL